MKKVVAILFVALFSLSLFAQDNTLKFLGIPIDGPKSQMITALKNKGFVVEKVGDEEVLIGDFNGRKSNIYIHTNRNVVDRVYVAYASYVDEAQIKIDFNNLLNQFKNNSKYVELEEQAPLSEKEDISYEMLVHKKRYDVVFYPAPKLTDDVVATLKAETAGMSEEDVQKYTTNWCFEQMSKGQVWFTISEMYGKYGISLYYDNMQNQSNGEDL